MTERAKQIGDTPLVDSSCDASNITPGITYRQWLIGQALAGCNGCSAIAKSEIAIKTVEYILAQLASEDK